MNPAQIAYEAYVAHTGNGRAVGFEDLGALEHAWAAVAEAVAARFTVEDLERLHGCRIDVVYADGTHRYWSTHCRHAEGTDDTRHLACGLAQGVDANGEHFARRPAQCKTETCRAHCVCPCGHGA